MEAPVFIAVPLVPLACLVSSAMRSLRLSMGMCRMLPSEIRFLTL